MEVARYSFHLNSAQRNSGTNTDMNIQLSQVISLLAKNSGFQCIIHGVTIPFSFYQLASDYNTVSIRVVTGATYNGTITLTAGNYNVNTVNDELKAKVIAFCQSIAVPFTPTLSFVYNVNTSKTTLSISTVSTTITLFFSTNLNLGLFFGFSTNAIFTSVSSAVGDKTAVANPVHTIFLRSPSLKQFKNREWQIEQDTFSDILYRIPIYTNTNTYISNYGDSEPVWLVNNVLSAINFYITSNLSYTALNLQGLDWVFHFTIIEREKPEYISITTTMLTNQPQLKNEVDTTDTTDELDLLQEERDRLIKRVEKYRSKLDVKPQA